MPAYQCHLPTQSDLAQLGDPKSIDARNRVHLTSSSGASRGSHHRSARLKVEKARFDAWGEGPENRKYEVNCAPLSAAP